MEIGKKLKNARIEAGLTQEKAAEKIDVSRQTISNWENEKSYPDIISVIALSDLYSVSLDELLKGDQKMAEHLEESTNVVKSNNDQNRNRYRAEEEKKYDPTFEDDHSEGYTNVQNDSQKRDKDLRCKILYLFYISHDLRLKPSGLHFLVIGDRQLLKLAD